MPERLDRGRRSAIHSDNIIEALVAGEGLIHYGDPRDNQSIVDITHHERKVITYLTWALLDDCSPNAARTLQLMREQAPDQRRKIESTLKSNSPNPSVTRSAIPITKHSVFSQIVLTLLIHLPKCA